MDAKQTSTDCGRSLARALALASYVEATASFILGALLPPFLSLVSIRMQRMGCIECLTQTKTNPETKERFSVPYIITRTTSVEQLSETRLLFDFMFAIEYVARFG